MTEDKAPSVHGVTLAGNVCTEYPLRATVTLYTPQGLRVPITYQHVDADKFGGLLIGFIDGLLEAGYSQTEPGLEPGEERWHCIGWSLAVNSKNEDTVVVYFDWKPYGEKIWLESIPKLGIDLSRAPRKTDSFLPREDAVSKGVFVAEPMDLIFVQETDHNGSPKFRQDKADPQKQWPVMRFDRRADGTPREPAAEPAAATETPVDQDAQRRHDTLTAIKRRLTQELSGKYAKLPAFAAWAAGVLKRGVDPQEMGKLSDDDIALLDLEATEAIEAGKVAQLEEGGNDIPF